MRTSTLCRETPTVTQEKVASTPLALASSRIKVRMLATKATQAPSGKERTLTWNLAPSTGAESQKTSDYA